MHEKVIGILGGQGPEATLDFFRRIIQNTPAQKDQEHFHILVECNPKVPNPNNAVTKNEPDPTEMLCANAKNLEKAGADFIVIPCNTVHIFLHEITQSVQIPIVSIVDAAINALVNQVPQAKKVGLLASPAVNKTGLYTKPLAARGISTLLPDEEAEQKVHDVIFSVKAGDKSPAVIQNIRSVCDEMIAMGAQALILGCTEIPLILHPSELPVPGIDTLEVLALAAIAYGSA